MSGYVSDRDAPDCPECGSSMRRFSGNGHGLGGYICVPCTEERSNPVVDGGLNDVTVHHAADTLVVFDRRGDGLDLYEVPDVDAAECVAAPGRAATDIVHAYRDGFIDEDDAAQHFQRLLDVQRAGGADR